MKDGRRRVPLCSSSRMRQFHRRLLQVFGDGDMERLFLGCFAGRFKAGYAEFAAFQFVALAPLRLQRLGRGYAGTCTAPRPAEVPLDVVAGAGKSVPIVVAFGFRGMESIFHRPSDLMRLTMRSEEHTSELQSLRHLV